MNKIFFILILVLSSIFPFAQDQKDLYQKAMQAFEDDKPKKAITHLTTELDYFPQHVEARILRIEINLKEQNYTAACADINALREYGRKESESFECPDCANKFIQRNEAINIDTSKARPDMDVEAPIYPGGDEAMFNDISRNLVYPPDCKELNISGKINMKFIIECDGSISNIQAVNTIENGRSLEMEAHKAIVHLKRFSSPAKQFGKAVRQEMILPITFKLK